MTHDLVIRNGSIVDGTGAEPRSGDVAVDDGVITAVGDIAGRGRDEIDAHGMLVTPGFIDPHTHLDAQVGWDPMLTPVSSHGITTVMMGNCGVTFAPCKPQDREYLASIMETVEDIPRKAILDGLPWDWTDFGGYLDSIERLKPGINVAGMVGHAAIRYMVMGERGLTEDATADEHAEMAPVAAESVDRGAVGFSTNRLELHLDPDGRAIPGTFAAHEEITDIAREVGPRGGLMQFILSVRSVGSDLELLGKTAAAGGGRVLFSQYAEQDQLVEGGSIDDTINEYRARGLDVSALTLPRPLGMITGLDNLLGLPDAEELQALSLADRVSALASGPIRDRFLANARDKSAPRWKELGVGLRWMGNDKQPEYLTENNRSLAELAAEAGERPAETYLRLLIDSDGRSHFSAPFGGNRQQDDVATLLRSGWVLPGLGDAGAHVSQSIDVGYASFFLAHWHRDTGEFSLGEAIRMITSGPARVLGLADRGTLTVGARADINVIDLDRLSWGHPEIRHDFPHGAPRFVQSSSGYVATICNGTVIVRDDELTGARGGQVLRGGQG